MKKRYMFLISFIIFVVTFFSTTLTVKAEPVTCCDQWGECRTNIDRMYCNAIGRVVGSCSACGGGSKTPTPKPKTPTPKPKTPTPKPGKTPDPTPIPTPVVKTPRPTPIGGLGEWKDAQGYKVTIIRYSYETQTEEPLASILLYTSTLVGDITLDLPGPIPTNKNELSFDGVYLIGSQGITTSCTTKPVEVITSSKKLSSSDFSPGSWKYNITTDEYATSYRRVTYRGSDIIYNDTYVNSFLEENAGPGTIDALVQKYTGGQDAVLKNFGVYISPEEADKFYVSAEPLQRLIDIEKDNLYIYGKYVHHEFTETTLNSDSWSGKDWKEESHYVPDTMDCNCVPKTKSVTNYYPTNCPDGCKHSLGNTFAGATGNCGTTCCCSKTVQVPDGQSCSACNNDYTYYTYTLGEQKCGAQLRYLIYGYYGYGTSRVVTSRAMHFGLSYDGYIPATTDSEHLGRSQNVKEEHKECILDANDVCTNKYEYYIGPDLPKALVGTESSNKFHFVDVSGLEGIEHYYWIDIPPCPDGNCDKCVDVCDEVGTKDSNEYLKCAENFCEASVDYDLEGSQRERKKTCLLEQCHYVYGKEPDTGRQPTNYPNNKYHSESVNSCNNSDPFAMYKGRELLGNNSICNKDTNTGNQMQYVPGYFEECVSDEITDYDGNDTNDTRFDFRTYIVKTCLESTSMEYPDLSGIEFLAGEGIAYYVVQNSNRECRYYMNLEQWKFDYASISEKDTARKNRLKYIYDVFNNSLTDGYSGTQSSYYYNGTASGNVDFAEEGYGLIDIREETFEDGKESIDSRVAEVVLNQQTESLVEKLKVIDSSKHDEREIYFSNDTLTLIEANTISYIGGVNRFVTTSEYSATYGFDKECLTTEGKSDIYKANSEGTCYKLVKGSKSEAYEGVNVHYTSLDATPNSKITTGGHHGFTTTALVIKDETGALYYQNNETCDYTIGDPGDRCYVTYTGCGKEGPVNIEVVEYGDKYPGETRSFTLRVYRKNGENKELVYEGSGKEHVFTPEINVSARYYMEAIMTSSLLGDINCSNSFSTEDTCKTKDCTTENLPADLAGISKWCSENWIEDIHHYKGPEVCVKHCSKGCPDDCLNVDVVENFCELNYEKLGLNTKGQCVNYCYCAAEGDFVFRPISNIEPFPEREAGPNWVGLEELITKDDDDPSSITGVNANQTVEYVIDFTSSTIRSIRSNTDRIKTEGSSPYTDLIYKNNTNPTKCKKMGGQTVCEIGNVSEYRSKFIHDSDMPNGGFSSIFVNGTLKSGGKSVAIEYTPGNDFTNK